MVSRTATKRKEQALPAWRRTLQLVLAALGSLCVLAILAGAGWQLSRLPIERVVVTGSLQHVSREQLEKMVVDSLQGGSLSADLNYIREPLERLPWVHRVVIKRRWPSSLEIEVTEQYPIARWGSTAYVNHEGEIFRPDGVRAARELPLLEGPLGRQRELMQLYKHIQEQLQSVELQVQQLTMNDRGGLSAQLRGGCELVFGSEDVSLKLQRFLAVYALELGADAANLQRVDMRYGHGLAVTWRGAQQ